jgi:hypothetical protein
MKMKFIFVLVSNIITCVMFMLKVKILKCMCHTHELFTSVLHTTLRHIIVS